MVAKLGNNWARGEKYEVRGKNKDTFIYMVNATKYIIIGWEAGIYDRLIYSSMIKEWTEPNGIPITRKEKEEIKKNCKEGWEFLNVLINFDD